MCNLYAKKFNQKGNQDEITNELINSYTVAVKGLSNVQSADN